MGWRLRLGAWLLGVPYERALAFVALDPIIEAVARLRRAGVRLPETASGKGTPDVPSDASQAGSVGCGGQSVPESRDLWLDQTASMVVGHFSKEDTRGSVWVPQGILGMVPAGVHTGFIDPADVKSIVRKALDVYDESL